MNDPVLLENNYFVAPQIQQEDLSALKTMGFQRIINNRPDGESDDQPLSVELKAVAQDLGLEYVENAIDLKLLNQAHVDSQAAALSEAKKTLAFCRTGTRSSVLWVLMQNAQGGNYTELSAAVAAKGFDLSRCEAAMAPLVK